MDKNKQAVSVFDRQAKVYQAKYMDISMYTASLDSFCNTIEKPDAKILDIGCGPGNITMYISQKLPDSKITGIDLAPSMIELAQKNNINARFEVMDCRSIAKLTQRYDAIICGFCLPYLNKLEAKKLIKDCRNLLKPGGLIYLSTMEGNHESSTLVTGTTGDQIFTHYYSADFLIGQLESKGFEIICISRIVTNAQSKSPVTDLVIIGTLPA